MKSESGLFSIVLLLCAACGQAPQSPQTPTGAATVTTPAPSNSAGSASLDPVARGKKIFLQCAACHSVEPGKNGIGPSLHGVSGRRAASVAGFEYSQPMISAGVTWDDDALSAYLESPQTFVENNKMAFIGVKNAQDRADLIAYLNTLQ